MKKLRMQKLLSVLIMAMGIVLMAMKVYADSEPGAIPLLLIVAGIGCYIFTLFKIRSQHS